MNSVYTIISSLVLGLFFCTTKAHYNGLDFEPSVQNPKEFLSPQIQAARLIQRLGNLDRRFSGLYNSVDPDQPMPLPDLRSPSYFDFSDSLVPDVIPSQRKRQSSTGAQICIWKVCPPSPWRRASKPRSG